MEIENNQTLNVDFHHCFTCVNNKEEYISLVCIYLIVFKHSGDALRALNVIESSVKKRPLAKTIKQTKCCFSFSTFDANEK